MKLNIKVTRLGCLNSQLMFAVTCLRKIERPWLEYAATLSGFFFKILVQLHRVILQSRDIVVVVQAVNTSGGMPGRARREFITFEQHDILPAQFAQMIENTAANKTATNNNRLSVTFQAMATTRLFSRLSLSSGLCPWIRCAHLCIPASGPVIC